MTPRRRALMNFGIGAVVATAMAAVAYVGGLRFNLTPSYALGIWRIMPLDREVVVGDLIFICPPPTASFAVARERGYLRPGLCPGWFSPLIKTIVAKEGQHVGVGRTIVIDGSPLPYSQIRQSDADGRVLIAHAGGFVPPGHLFLYSTFAGSYDSRYFGPIPAAGVLGLAQPVLTLTP